ncbi:MAG: class I SAM-dependent methyltransferase [Candidatus Doudnabacteria bacterium]|nr:class I SAM-dependent methyltransferase [Candidatus Doudnabacteria bacterium]
MSDYHDQIKRDWNARADAWNASERPEFFDLYQQNESRFGNKVVDIGCGKGRYTKFLEDKGKQVVGIDISEEMLKGARAAGVQADLRQGISSQLPFEDGSFDSAVSIGAIHHNMWVDIQKSFSEAARVLKPDSIFVFQGRSVKDTMSPRQQVADYGYTAVDTEGDKRGIQHYFTLEELQELARQNDFEIEGEPKEILENRNGKVWARWWVIFKKK